MWFKIYVQYFKSKLGLNILFYLHFNDKNFEMPLAIH